MNQRQFNLVSLIEKIRKGNGWIIDIKVSGRLTTKGYGYGLCLPGYQVRD